jgi:hypothetical protein
VDQVMIHHKQPEVAGNPADDRQHLRKAVSHREIFFSSDQALFTSWLS